MSKSEQVDFFVHCQKLLVENHPKSSFVCRQNNIKERLHQIRAWVDKYKGMCYWDDNVCVLYNRIVVSDPDQPEQAIKANMYHPPDPNYNAIVIDFAAFKDIKDCLPFVTGNYDQRIVHVLFVRHGKVKMYPTANIVSQIFNMPII